MTFVYWLKNRRITGGRVASVYPPNVAAWHNAYTRGEQLINQLDDIRAISGRSKFSGPERKRISLMDDSELGASQI